MGSSTTMSMYLMTLKCTLKNGWNCKFYVTFFCIFYHDLKKKCLERIIHVRVLVLQVDYGGLVTEADPFISGHEMCWGPRF